MSACMLCGELNGWHAKDCRNLDLSGHALLANATRAPVDFAALAATERQELAAMWEGLQPLPTHSHIGRTVAALKESDACIATLQKERDELCAAMKINDHVNADLCRQLGEAERERDQTRDALRCFIADYEVRDLDDEDYDKIAARAHELWHVVEQLAAARAECAVLSGHCTALDTECARLEQECAALTTDRDNWRAMSETEAASAKFAQDGARTLMAECAALRKVFAEFLAALDHVASVDTTHDLAATLYYAEAEKAARAAIAQGKT